MAEEFKLSDTKMVLGMVSYCAEHGLDSEFQRNNDGIRATFSLNIAPNTFQAYPTATFIEYGSDQDINKKFTQVSFCLLKNSNKKILVHASGFKSLSELTKKLEEWRVVSGEGGMGEHLTQQKMLDAFLKYTDERKLRWYTSMLDRTLNKRILVQFRKGTFTISPDATKLYFNGYLHETWVPVTKDDSGESTKYASCYLTDENEKVLIKKDNLSTTVEFIDTITRWHGMAQVQVAHTASGNVEERLQRVEQSTAQLLQALEKITSILMKLHTIPTNAL